MDLQKRLRGERGSSTSSVSPVRSLTRVAMLGGIAGLAVLQGYTVTTWVWVIVAVGWAACLPFLLRRTHRFLLGIDLEGWQRTTLLVVAGALLLAGLAATIQKVLP